MSENEGDRKIMERLVDAVFSKRPGLDQILVFMEALLTHKSSVRFDRRIGNLLSEFTGRTCTRIVHCSVIAET